MPVPSMIIFGSLLDQSGKASEPQFLNPESQISNLKSQIPNPKSRTRKICSPIPQKKHRGLFACGVGEVFSVVADPSRSAPPRRDAVYRW